MPTAVELKYALDLVDGRGEQDIFKDASATIGAEFLKIDATDSTAQFLKIEDSHKFQDDVSAVGGFFLRAGAEFEDLALVAVKYDSFALKLDGSPPSIDTTTLKSDAIILKYSDLQSDFEALLPAVQDTAEDFSKLGVDFLKLDFAPNLATWIKYEGDVQDEFIKLARDSFGVGSDFDILGSDFLKLDANVVSSNLSGTLDKFGGDLKNLGAEFDQITTDFLKLDQTLNIGSATSGAGAGKETFGQFGTELKILDTDFLKINNSIAELGGLVAPVLRALGENTIGGSNGEVQLWNRVENVLGIGDLKI